MRILLLCHTFNSLTQRVYAELAERGHELSVELDINDRTTIEAVERFNPDLIVAPYLRRAIPETVWRRHRCLVVHPGPPGDRGPSALDWAIVHGESSWGVTVLQAEAGMDAGPIWAARDFPMREARKSSLYRFEVTEAAVQAVLEAVAHAGEPGFRPVPASRFPSADGRGWQPLMRQPDRHIDWTGDDMATVMRKIRAADGNPGVEDEILGVPCRIVDAQPATGWRGVPGEILAQHLGAVCRATGDGAVWLGHLRPLGAKAVPFKLAATAALGRDRLAHVPGLEAGSASERRAGYGDIRYEEQGPVGFVHFDFYNGAMSTERCRRLLAVYRHAISRPTRVIVLMGGRDFWSNGLDLNTIEAAASPADESWLNINAMDDLAEAIISTTDKLTIAAMQGNAGAGGVFLALAADEVYARRGIVLNPHYQNMGNLFGSEYWTYLLPRRVGEEEAGRIMRHRLPVLSGTAKAWGVIDDEAGPDPADFRAEVSDRARRLAHPSDFARHLAVKRQSRRLDEAARPLAAYRADELERMRLNFYGFDPSYHVARYKFVHRVPHAWTPLYLARHRQLGRRIPELRPIGAET